MLCSVNSIEENCKLDGFVHNRSSYSSMSKTFQVPCPLRETVIQACSHLAHNKNFTSESAGQALITQQVKL
ncbi:hypothetical protein R3W88_021259 [Solanum pinnatisectum]|uniref:Uncharacterized protein n=1 Tax=Solanum pinnatisectum TaxID=50273 RepID=A0AAV9LRC3_9SOLN|nr:hypothetical protein R3W88_021259 [Solanum pinnatisectum]